MSDYKNQNMPPVNRKVDNHDVALEVYIDALLIEDDFSEGAIAVPPVVVKAAPAVSAEPVQALPVSEPEISIHTFTIIFNG